MKDIQNISNHELGIIFKAFNECEKYAKCIDCPCDGVICSIGNFVNARETFINEVAKRLIESK